MGEAYTSTKYVPVTEFHKQYGFPFTTVPFPRELKIPEQRGFPNGTHSHLPTHSPSVRPTARKRRKTIDNQFSLPQLSDSFHTPTGTRSNMNTFIKQENMGLPESKFDLPTGDVSHHGISASVEAHFQSVLRELRKNAGNVPRYLIDKCVTQLRQAGRHELADEMMLAVEIDEITIEKGNDCGNASFSVREVRSGVLGFRVIVSDTKLRQIRGDNVPRNWIDVCMKQLRSTTY